MNHQSRDLRPGPALQHAVCLPAIILAVALGGCQANQHLTENNPMTERTVTLEDQTLTLQTEFEDDFTTDRGCWLSEGTDRVAIGDGKLSIDAVRGQANVATVWCMQDFTGDQVIEYTARIEPTVNDAGHGETNMNFILFASDPSGVCLQETSTSRTGAYKEYHALNNYILTYLNADLNDRMPIHGDHGPQLVRIRFRKDPGFELLQEARREPPIEKQRDYHFVITVQGDRIRCYVDGDKIVDITDATYRTGWHGFRTWMSHLTATHFRVSRVASAK